MCIIIGKTDLKKDFFRTGAISIFYGCFMDIYWIPIFIDFIVELKLFVHRNAIFDETLY